MSTPSLAPSPVLIPFVCPSCTGQNAVHLISLSRAGGVDCAGCGKYLRAADVMRAIHSPRSVGSQPAAPVRASTQPSKRGNVTWPPTKASRDAAEAVHAAFAKRT